MKTLLFTVSALVAASILTISCSDDDKPTPSTPQPPEGMVLVQGTTFTMGVDSATAYSLGTIHDYPKHQVTVASFYIDEYEVTQAEYKEFVDATGHRTPFINGTHHDADSAYAWSGTNFPSGKADHPVVGIDYSDAEAYCQWKGKRLPTEAEWELAARGTDERLYPWGNMWNDANCNSELAGTAGTAPVGTFPADKSPFGCYDMAGNAIEWTSTWFTSYPGNPNSLTPMTYRVPRGGSWDNLDSGDKLANTFSRHAHGPTRIDRDGGCRCAKNAE